jgi:hypothetical protein
LGSPHKDNQLIFIVLGWALSALGRVIVNMPSIRLASTPLLSISDGKERLRLNVPSLHSRLWLVMPSPPSAIIRFLSELNYLFTSRFFLGVIDNFSTSSKIKALGFFNHQFRQAARR